MFVMPRQILTANVTCVPAQTVLPIASLWTLRSKFSYLSPYAINGNLFFQREIEK